MSKLNLGCGTDIRSDHINVDIQNLPGVDMVADISTMSINLDSFKYIVLQNVLEYIPRKEILPLLKKIYNGLNSSGTLEIRCLDILSVTKSLYLNSISSEMGLHHEMVISLLYGRGANPYDIKQSGFTSEFLQGLLIGVGFKVVSNKSENFDFILTVSK